MISKRRSFYFQLSSRNPIQGKNGNCIQSNKKYVPRKTTISFHHLRIGLQRQSTEIITAKEVHEASGPACIASQNEQKIKDRCRCIWISLQPDSKMPANHNSEARTKCQNEVRNYHNKGILSPKRTRSMGDLRLDASTRRDQIAKWHQEHNEASDEMSDEMSDEILKSFQQVAVLVKNVAGQMEISRLHHRLVPSSAWLLSPLLPIIIWVCLCPLLALLTLSVFFSRGYRGLCIILEIQSHRTSWYF